MTTNIKKDLLDKTYPDLRAVDIKNEGLIMYVGPIEMGSARKMLHLSEKWFGEDPLSLALEIFNTGNDPDGKSHLLTYKKLRTLIGYLQIVLDKKGIESNEP